MWRSLDKINVLFCFLKETLSEMDQRKVGLVGSRLEDNYTQSKMHSA